MKKIIVPVDFSDNALKAAFYAAQLAAISGGTVYLVHVLETGHEKLYQPFTLRVKFNNIIISDTDKQLNEWKNIVGSKYTKVPVKVEVLGGNPPDRTAQYAREQKADLIVIGVFTEVNNGHISAVLRKQDCHSCIEGGFQCIV